jgi:hypothetical protein
MDGVLADFEARFEQYSDGLTTMNIEINLV